MSEGWQVGIDIGGTFTDVVAFRPGDGPQRAEMRQAKVRSRPDDPVQGLEAALDSVGVAWGEVEDLVHGTTMVTNAIVENRLAEVALIATKGFADTIEIGRQNRRHLYRLDLPPKAPCQVPRERRFEVDERLDFRGTVLAELSEAEIEEVARQVAASGASAVAVSLLHAYANPAHERRLGERLRQVVPYVALSHQINPEAREYERSSTTALSASLMPLASRYLDKLEARRPDDSHLHLFHSAGGMAAPAVLRDLPLGLALSGPAAGVAAAEKIARALDIDYALSFDMGGTTSDVCLIAQGRAEVRSDRSLGERPLRQPMVAVESIGAGGGSIARLDHGALRVGPESAGAEPGPACYGRGGERPTVSDANLLLGYLTADHPVGGGLRLEVAAAERVLAPLAEEIGVGLPEAALGVVRVANASMARALRRVTVERGIDGRHCTLLAFGGAGPMHAVELARSFGIGKVIVPQFSSAFSALGCVTAETAPPRGSARSPPCATAARATRSRSSIPRSTTSRAWRPSSWPGTRRSTALPPTSPGSWCPCARQPPCCAPISRTGRSGPRTGRSPRNGWTTAGSAERCPWRRRATTGRRWLPGMSSPARRSSRTPGRPWCCRPARR
jgi:N-methylhydantoinase A